MLLSVDPGANSGWALFFHDALVTCGLNEPTIGAPSKLDLLIVERPVKYPHDPVLPNDLITLALSAGEWVGRYRSITARVHYVEPRVWKGTLDKKTCNDRVLARLSETERQVFDTACHVSRIPKGKQNNVIDAIGIGLYALDRFRR